MERHEVLAMMTTLKLAGMRTAYDDILADGLKRRHPVQQIIGALLKAEIADKTARPPGCRRPRSWPTSTLPPRRSTSP